mmetsp:Transcript_14162/g.40106  ORF Transcript_14162/g.40106 Transcript_14162/m.40106 type:complete len:519 (+) Transcript_14162:1224-2780(+)
MVVVVDLGLGPLLLNQLQLKIILNYFTHKKRFTHKKKQGTTFLGLHSLPQLLILCPSSAGKGVGDAEGVDQDGQAASCHHRSGEGGVQGEAKREQGPRGEGKGHNVVHQGPTKVLFDLPEGHVADRHCLLHLHERGSPGGQQDQVRRRGRGVSGRLDGNSNVSRCEGRGVVDPIPNHGDSLALLLELRNEFGLLEGRLAPESLAALNPNTLRDKADCFLPVSAEHVHLFPQPLQGVLGVLPHCIHERHPSHDALAFHRNVNKRGVATLVVQRSLLCGEIAWAGCPHEVLDPSQAPHRSHLAIQPPLHPSPDLVLHVFHRNTSTALPPLRGIHDPPGDGVVCGGVPLEAGGQMNQLRLAQRAPDGFNPRDARPTFRNGSRLIHDNGVHLGKLLQDVSTPDQDPLLGGKGCSHQDGGWGGQAKGARARDNQDVHCVPEGNARARREPREGFHVRVGVVHQKVLEKGVPKALPEDKRRGGQAQDQVHERPAYGIREPLDRSISCLGGLNKVLHCLDGRLGA